MSSEINEVFNQEENAIELSMGNKVLSVSLPTDEYPEFVTGIVKTPDDVPRIPGATTALYIRASQIMQDTVNRLGKPITYCEIIDHPKMIQWARAHGKIIFNWYVNLDTAEEFIAERIFTPEQ